MKKSHFRQLLRSKSCKATPARLAVLAVLEKSAKPMSAQDVQRKLGKSKYDQVTIYRTLQTLADVEILKQVSFHDGVAYYEPMSLGEHHHAVCTNCNVVEDIKNCCVETMEKVALKQSGFASINSHSLEFFGLCKQCAS